MEIVLDKTSPIPLYFQLENFLRKVIIEGDIKIGEALPTEAELQEKLGVSRNTIRQAIDRLASEGLVVKKRSKGTVVILPVSKIAESITGLTFTESVFKKGQVPTTKLLDFKIIEPIPKVASILNLKEDEKVFYSKRLRFINNRPVCITDSCIPASFVPGVSPEDFSETGWKQSIYFLLENKYHFEISHWVESIEALPINKKNANVLDVRPYSAGLLRRDIVYSNSGEVVGYNETLFAGNYQIKGLIYKREKYSGGL